MQDTLQQQLDISKNLLESLDRMVNSFEIMLGRTSMQQSNMANDINQSMKNSKDTMDQALSKATSMARQMSQSDSKRETDNIAKSASSFSQIINKSLKNAKSFFKKSTAEFLKNNKISKSLKKSTIAINKTLKNKTLLVSEALNKASSKFKTVALLVKGGRWVISMLSKAIGMVNSIKNAFATGGLSLLKDFPSLILSSLKSLFSIFTSLIGAATKFFTFSLSIPFTIAKFASNIGYSIRSELVEIIQSAGEEAKESFDLTSHIGQSAAKLTNMSKGLLKGFQSPRSRLSKLFGMGAQGAARFLTETFKAVDGMGHYAEFFGESLMGSVESGQYLIEMQRAMGLGQKELAYYAMEAFNSGKHPVDILHNTSNLLKEAADGNDLDFKALTKEFNTLRVNIVEFGHMSSNEIKDLVVKLRKMKVKTDDAVSVFKKFTTLEEASKASAMLFQSFQMNIDAFDLLTARDPGEMLTQFRDAMFETGRSFKDLNRHEKALMTSTIGISENGLKSLMNYMDVGLTYDQAKKKLEEQDPTKQQTKMIKGLTSTIKMVQKTMQFKSPFDAFFQGLSKNMAMHGKLKSSVISLSKIYEDFFHLGLSLNTNELNSMLQPIAHVLKRISETLTGPDFKNTMLAATSAAGELFSGVAYDLNDKRSKEMIKFDQKVKKASEFFKENQDSITSAKATALQTIISGNKIDLGSKSGLDKMIFDSFVKKGLISNSKKFGPKIAEKMTLEKASKIFLSLRNQYKSNPKALEKLDNIFNDIETEFNKQLLELDPTGSNLERLDNYIRNSKSIKNRINNFYKKLNNAFEKGSKPFKNIVDIGGTMMGSIIRGVMTGIAAGLRIFTKGADMTAESLGIKLDQETKDRLIKEGKDPKEYSLFDWLGMTQKERDAISSELGKESATTIGFLPDFVGFMGSFVSDLTNVFYEFALGLLGFAGDVFYEYYKSWDDVPVIGAGMQGALRSAGFNPQEALRLKSRSKGQYKAANIAKGIDEKLLKDSLRDEKGNEKESYIGTFVDLFQEMRATSIEGSPINYFLNNKKVLDFVNYASDRSNFKNFELWFNALDDADEPQRAQAILDVIDRAYQINVMFPQKVYQDYRDSGNKNATMDALIKNTNKKADSLAEGLPDYNDIGDMLGFSAGYGSSMSDIEKKISSIKKQNYKSKALMNRKRLGSIINVNDASLDGKNTVAISNGKIINFHNKDIIGVKPKGWINNLFIKVSEHYNSITKDATDCLVEEIHTVKAENENIKANNLALKKSIINKDDTDQVSESEMSNLFSLSMEVVSLFVNRDIVSKKVDTKFER